MLRLVLNNWRAEAVVHQARQGLTVVFALPGVGCIMGGIAFFVES